ncbi:hypothetical protein [uncultured Imperialibacter sp.]|uniref:hypothetical protein n=1 Tax=uncultured Imperialibacter sp. TaxID=1672639 RepID=UPI0030DBD83C|tara:strand:- start:92048 stop:92830 length:783 start_codon:yes stop_codon:yes gene_type:complete
MKKIRSVGIVIGLFALVGCFKEDSEVIYTYEVSPYAELKDIWFTEGGDNQPDSLFVSIFLADEEMDIGLLPSETYHPYEWNNKVVDSKSQILKWDESNYYPPFFLLIPYRDRIDTVLYSQSDPREDDIESCHNSNLTEDGNLFKVENTFRHNIFVDLMVEFDGEFIPFGKLFTTSDCYLGYDARLPPPPSQIGTQTYIGSPFKISRFNKFEIEIQYSLLSQAFSIFKDRRYRLSISIADRALNRTDLMESEELRLPDIKK